jgi:hypothetical protein
MVIAGLSVHEGHEIFWFPFVLAVCGEFFMVYGYADGACDIPGCDGRTLEGQAMQCLGMSCVYGAGAVDVIEIYKIGLDEWI